MEWPPLKTTLQEKLEKVWLGIAFILVAVLAFEAGWLKRSLGESEPLIITTPESLPAVLVPARQTTIETKTLPSPASVQGSEGMATCMFVGSKKSNKYHAPTSRCAKQIKAENRLCFDSVEAAKAKGYISGCLE